MLDRRAVNQYLDAFKDDHSRLKKLTHRQVDAIIADLRPRPKIRAPLMLHQKVCFLLGIAYPQFFFLLDMGCVDCETEYLSPTGWKRIDQFIGGEVAQYNPESGTAEFILPTQYVKKPCSWMYRFKTSRSIDQKLSPEHRVLYHKNGKACVAPATQVVEEYNSLKMGWKGKFYTTFIPKLSTTVSLSTTQLRVQVAVIADGTFPGKSTRCIINIKKNRKKNRLRALLKEAGIPWKENKGGAGYIRFVFTAPRKDKYFSEFYWKSSIEQLKIIADECAHWDSHIRTSGAVIFSSRVRASSDFIQYAFSATGRTASLRSSNGVDFEVYARTKSVKVRLHGVKANGKKTEPITTEATTDGYKYCFEVPSKFLVLRRNGYIFMSGNTGKTLVTLELARYWFMLGELRRMLICVPADTVVLSWRDEIKKWAPELEYVLLMGSSERKWEQFYSLDQGLAIVSYPGLNRMVARPPKKRKGKKDKKSKKLKVDKNDIREIASAIQAIAFDESTWIGNYDSLSHEVCYKISRGLEFRYALAGRAFGRDPTPLWAQFLIVDNGESLGPTLGLFREAFFTKKENPYGGMYSFNYTFDPTMEEDLAYFMGHRSIRYAIEECVDLPPLTKIVRRTQLTEDIDLYYQKFVDEIIKAKGNYRVVDNAFLRMRQLSSGFLGFKDDITGAKAEIEFDENPKLEELLHLVQSVPQDRKFVIFHEFTHSGRKIMEALKELNIKAGWVWSGTKNYEQLKERFDNDRSMRGLVVNWRKGGIGLNLQAASYCFVYESPVGGVARDQMVRRVWRTGQKWRTFLYDLVVEDTVDERILAFHKAGTDLFKALVRDPGRTLRSNKSTRQAA